MFRKERFSSETKPSGKRQMARFTLDCLRQRKKKAEDELQELGRSSDGHQRASLHDDPASEERRNMLRAIKDSIGNLERVEIIQPRRDTSQIGLGNKVTVEFPDGEKDTYTILSDDDAAHGGRTDIISYRSPIGSALLGKQRGETVVCKLPNKRQIELKIRKIVPGDF